jgi:hypothetical protein
MRAIKETRVYPNAMMRKATLKITQNVSCGSRKSPTIPREQALIRLEIDGNGGSLKGFFIPLTPSPYLRQHRRPWSQTKRRARLP